jgi:hypothetical protein
MNRHRTAFLILLVVLLPIAAGAQSPDSSAAMVTSISGSAVLGVRGTSTPLELGQDIPLGATVKAETGSVAVVFRGGEFFELKEKEELTFGATPAASTLSDRGATRGVGADETVAVTDSRVELSDRRKRLHQLANISTIRGDAMPIAVSPRLVVADPAFQFIWFDSDSAAAGTEKSYTLVLRDEHTVVAQKDLRGPAYRINSIGVEDVAKEFRLAPGRHYSWGIFERSKLPAPETKLDASFVIADEGTLSAAAAMQKKQERLVDDKKVDETSSHMLLAMYYLDERERLYADALPHLFAIADTPKGRAYADAEIVRVLQRFGNQVSVVAGYIAARMGTRN